MVLARVFPRKTAATPTDALAFYDVPGFFDTADEVHVSVTFLEDRRRAERLAREWERVAPVTVGGPAYDDPGGEFVPGRYVAPGYTITSRGCPHRCWFCSAWKREGNEVRELEIRDGWNVLDSNLLACSREHQERVFQMLSRQKKRPEFTGGLDPTRFTDWHAEWMVRLKAEALWFAYDGPEDRDAIHAAAEVLNRYGLPTVNHNRVRCYVLVGGPKDTLAAAEGRLREAAGLGYLPMAMLYRNGTDAPSVEWERFQRIWARPTIIRRLTPNRA